MANKCVMTGATGYIGSHVLKYLLSKGWEIHVIADPKFGYANIEDVLSQIDVFEYDGNILSLCDYFQTVKPDVVYHLAAAVITNYKPEQVPILIQSNIQFGAEILEAMKSSDIKLLVSTGSYWQNYNSDSYNPVDLYAATKEAFEKIVQFYVDAYGFRHINLRLYDVYGEDDKRPKLWNTLRAIAGTGQHIAVSPGEQLLDLIHISDVCTAYEAAYYALISDNSISNEVYGVRTGITHSLKDAITVLEKALCKKTCVDYGAKPYKEREVMIPYRKYAYIPGWNAQVTLLEGFKRFANK